MTESIPIQDGARPISSRKMVRFAANMPVDVALQCVDGIRVEGRYGDRVKYTLTDDRTMYVAPFVAERIKDLEIQPGELFQVCRRQVKDGNRRIIRWTVLRNGEDESQLEHELRESLAMANQRNGGSHPQASVPSFPHPRKCCEAPLSEADKHSYDGTQNGAGKGSIPLSEPSGDDVAPRPPDTQLAHALKTAIAAAADAEKFAKTLDYNVRFTTEDVRSMGITVLIGMQQRIPR
jgi:hypothetical protein